MGGVQHNTGVVFRRVCEDSLDTGEPVTVLKEGHAQRKLVAWNLFHKTGNSVLIENAVVLNWNSHTVTWNDHCSTVVIRKDGYTTFLPNVGMYLRVCTALKLRIATSSSPPSEHLIFPVCWPARNFLVELFTWNQFHATGFLCVWPALDSGRMRDVINNVIVFDLCGCR
jgi:hypothetical protein